MKKIGVVTLNDYVNFGNRLQNYALVKYLSKFNDCIVYNIWPKSLKFIIKDFIKRFLYVDKYKRISKFRNFNRLINTSTKINDFDYYVVGSDQVWNPQWLDKELMLLSNVDSNNKISYAASFGVNELEDSEKTIFKDFLPSFKSLSVRENSGVNIIKNLGLKNSIEVSIDPTMLLTADEWKKVSKQPKNYKGEKYILNYFLGDISFSRRKAIEKIAKENNCTIINVLDPNDKYYISGPSEFLWLEENAFLVCTDSFHSSVFAILFNKPFVIFDREEKGLKNMSTRIDTLLSKFQINDRRFNGRNITKQNLNHNYENAYKILEDEREKSKEFFKYNLNIK